MITRKKTGIIAVSVSSNAFTYENLIIDAQGLSAIYMALFQNCSGAIYFKNCTFRNTATPDREAVSLQNCPDVRFHNCSFERANIKAIDCNFTRFEVLNCRFKDVHAPFPMTALQLVNSVGSGIKLNYNRFHNISSTAIISDWINLFNSAGTAGSYIEIIGNWIKASVDAKYPVDYSGAGIVIGDGSSRACQYIRCEDNIIFDSSACGIQVVQMSPRVTTNVIFNRNKTWTDLRANVNGRSNVGLQLGVQSNAFEQFADNAFRCVRARFIGSEDYDPDNDIYSTLFSPTQGQAANRPAWLTNTLLPNTCFA